VVSLGDPCEVNVNPVHRDSELHNFLKFEYELICVPAVPMPTQIGAVPAGSRRMYKSASLVGK